MPEAPITAQQNVGLWLTGELVAPPTPSKPYTDKNGTLHNPVNVDLLVGRYVERVEFDSLAEAMAAIGGDASLREIVTIPVRARGGWDPGNRRFGRVSYSGRRSE